jgi:hypothetical protein
METPCSIMSDCQHLDNFMGDMDRCSGKRFLRIFNPKKGHDEYLVFCNDWLKLTVQQDKHEIVYGGYVNSKRYYCYPDVLEELVLSHIGADDVGVIRRGNWKSIEPICTSVADSPKIWMRLDIQTAIEWYKDNQSRRLFDMIALTIKRWCMTNERFKKHQSNCRTITSLLNKVHWCGDDETEQRDVYINEIFLTILKITTNEAH